MKFTNHTVHKDSIVDICDDGINIKDYIQVKINSGVREDKDDPFFVCDLGDIVKKWKKFRQWLPQVEPFYAIKCNPDAVVASLLAKLGANFDCASKNEIKQVLDLGVSPDRIIFANPCKQSSFIKYAAANNVKMMTFDNEPELYKIKNHFPNAELVIRIQVDDSKSLCKLGLKFGVAPAQAKDLLKVAKNLDLNVIGVSFHVGSGCYSASLFYDAVELAHTVFVQANEIGYKFTLLDVGGGFPGTDIDDITFEDTAKELTRGFDAFFQPSKGIRIIAEPGRFFVASALTSVCNVTSIRKVAGSSTAKSDKHPSDGFMYYLNDGVYGSFNCILFDHQHPEPYPLYVETNAQTYPCSVWGPTCDSMDCISKMSYLPKMNIGDWICFDNMGAYTCAAASKFNGYNLASIVYMCRDHLSHDVVSNSNAAVQPVKKMSQKLENIMIGAAANKM